MAQGVDVDVDVTGRPTRLRELDLDRFFHPEVVAVIGATDDTDSPSWMSWDQIRRWGQEHGATVVPVNPRRAEVDGLISYASILDVPHDVDLVAILIGKPEAVLPEVVESKARFAVLFSAGFAESGEAGEARQRAIVDLLEGSDLHLLGPNTTLNAFQAFHEDVGGGRRIGLVTQSGHQGRPLYQAQELGVGLAGWAPVGNEADLESADFIAYFAERADVGAVAAYIEGFKDGRTLMLAADRAARAGVPVTVVKVGRSAIGRSWARSHSGHLAGSDRVTDAVFRQVGIQRVDSLDQLLDVSTLLARAAPPRTDGVCVYSISGGTGAHTADLAGTYGLRLPELASGTQRRLHELIAPFLRVSNPVDSGGHPTGDERGPQILRAILDDPEVGVLLVPIPGAVPPISDTFAQDLVDAWRGTDKPVVVVWGSPAGDEPAYRDILVPSGIPVFRTVPNALRAIQAYLEHHAFVDGYRSPFGGLPRRESRAAAAARELLVPGQALSELTSKQVLRAYGIPTTDDRLATSASAAVAAARDLGLPVVMKVSSPRLLHRSDLGLVAVGVESLTAVRDTYRRLLDAAAEHTDAEHVEGVIVSPLVSGGVETIVGSVRDELFGPTVLFGIGGVGVEVYGDVGFRVPPFTRRQAHRMIEEVRGLALLQGAHGGPQAKLSAIVDVLMKVQRMALDLHDAIAELDINPLVVGPNGAIALDALVICGGRSDR
ncbi:MAG TPA: acetate--CoA ligase family protein [Nitriliruptorales bacterium]